MTEQCSKTEKGLDKSTTRAGIFSRMLWMMSVGRDDREVSLWPSMAGTGAEIWGAIVGVGISFVAATLLVAKGKAVPESPGTSVTEEGTEGRLDVPSAAATLLRSPSLEIAGISYIVTGAGVLRIPRLAVAC